MPAAREVRLIVHNWLTPPLKAEVTEHANLQQQQAKGIAISASLPQVADLGVLDESKAAMRWEESTRTLYMKFMWQANQTISIN